MVDLDDSLTPVLDEDTVKVSAFAAFDFDDPIVKIRWRGVKPPDQGGACCYVDPGDELALTICDDTLSRSECDALSGDFTPNATCDDNPCLGTCCEDDGDGGTICEDLTEDDCAAVGGDFKGIDTACDDDPDPCATGACCEDDGEGGFTCEDLTEDDCTAVGGTFKGIDTACDDVPDPCITGACCEDDGMGGFTCEDLSESDCSNVGGDFKGAGTACSDDPDPCLVCPDITLICDSVSKSLSKCGFFDSDSGKYYLAQVGSETNSGSSTATSSCTGEVFNVNWTFSRARLTTESYTLNDDGTCTYDGSFCGSDDSTIILTNDWPGDPCGTSTACNYSGGFDVCSGDFFTPYTMSCNIFGFCTVLIPGCIHAYVGTGSTFSTSFDDEYTTAMLIDNVERLLPDYSGDYFGGACASSRYLSTDEVTYSIQRSKPRFTFDAAPNDFTIEYVERFTPTGGGGSIDTPVSLGVSTGMTEIDGPELLEPATNGTTTIEDIMCVL